MVRIKGCFRISVCNTHGNRNEGIRIDLLKFCWVKQRLNIRYRNRPFGLVFKRRNQLPHMYHRWYTTCLYQRRDKPADLRVCEWRLKLLGVYG